MMIARHCLNIHAGNHHLGPPPAGRFGRPLIAVDLCKQAITWKRLVNL
jgi:hypothetical protein